jgi:hypothetical protein
VCHLWLEGLKEGIFLQVNIDQFFIFVPDYCLSETDISAFSRGQQNQKEESSCLFRA